MKVKLTNPRLNSTLHFHGLPSIKMTKISKLELGRFCYYKVGKVYIEVYKRCILMTGSGGKGGISNTHLYLTSVQFSLE